MTSSAELSRVPIKNLYYMLAYAWNHPHEKDLVSVFDEDEKDLLNLFAKILIKRLNSLIKRGFFKDYLAYEDEVAILRGKILFKESLERFSHKRARMQVATEDMSYDILHNQLIKATLFYLVRQDRLEQEFRDDLQRILRYFKDISLIDVRPGLFKEVKIHRNNAHYQFLLHICEFLWEGELLHEGDGEQAFHDFSRDHQALARLFESFLRNFYREELQACRVKSEILTWPALGDEDALALLPRMETDLSLDYAGEKFIIDAKFYQDTFVRRFDQSSIRSGHLYQLFAYLKNDEARTGEKAIGILLYPKVQESYDLSYEIHGYTIKVCTVDLNTSWQNIHDQLLGLVVG